MRAIDFSTCRSFHHRVNVSARSTFVYLFFFIICQVNLFHSSIYFEQQPAASCIHAAKMVLMGKKKKLGKTCLYALKPLVYQAE